jgi:hypothetical protein
MTEILLGKGVKLNKQTKIMLHLDEIAPVGFEG